MDNGGTSDHWPWAFRAIGGALVGVLGWVATKQDKRVDRLEDRTVRAESVMAAQEAHRVEISGRFDRLEGKVDRMDEKLDRLVGGLGGR